MIRDLIQRIVAWVRCGPDALWTEETVRKWKGAFPGRCMYCSYTRWANTEHGQSLALEPHNCIEGKSPPAPLPEARALP